MLCCWRLLATEAPRPKARQVAFSNCALKWTQARTRDNVAYELFLLVYVSETQASLPFGFPHFSWSYVWLLHFFLYFGKRLHVQWSVDLKEMRQQETSHGIVAGNGNGHVWQATRDAHDSDLWTFSQYLKVLCFVASKIKNKAHTQWFAKMTRTGDINCDCWKHRTSWWVTLFIKELKFISHLYFLEHIQKELVFLIAYSLVMLTLECRGKQMSHMSLCSPLAMKDFFNSNYRAEKCHWPFVLVTV